MEKSLRFALFVLAALSLAGFAVAQRRTEGLMRCGDYRDDGRLYSQCEIKEQTVPAGGTVNVDDRTNGGVSIKGWDRNEVLVRAKVETRAPTQVEADQLAG